MQWLVQELTTIRALLEQGAAPEGVVLSDSQRRAWVAARERLQRLVRRVSLAPGVTAAFVSYDGLVFEAEGAGPDVDALAAFAQQCEELVRRAGAVLALGQMNQAVIVGADCKLALVPLGKMILGFFCPSQISLSTVLERVENQRPVPTK